MTRDDALRLLELNHGHSNAELKAAYRDMLKVWHPDRFPADSALQTKATERTRLITEAFQLLTAGRGDASAPSHTAHVYEEARKAPTPAGGQATSPRGSRHPLGPLVATYEAKITALRNHRRVEVHDRGLVFRWRGREHEPESIPWGSIDQLSFWDLGSQSKVYGFVRVSFEQYFYVRVRGRKEIVLSEGLRRVENLFRDIDQATLAQRSTAIVEALHQGATVDLGAVQLSPDGVQARRKLLPWHQVAGAEVHKGYIHLFATTKAKSYAVIAYASTWNATPLLGILKHAAAHGTWPSVGDR